MSYEWGRGETCVLGVARAARNPNNPVQETKDAVWGWWSRLWRQRLEETRQMWWEYHFSIFCSDVSSNIRI